MAIQVNGEEIDDELIETEFRQIKSHYEQTLQVACCERDPEFIAQAKDNLVSRIVLHQEALKRFPEVDDSDITHRLQKLIEQAGGEGPFYANLGLTPADADAVRNNVANGVRLDLMLAEVYHPEPDPNEEEMQIWYHEHLNQFLTEEEIHAAHITKGLQGSNSRNDVYEGLRKVRKELLTGADFMTVAERERGEDAQQTDLGWFKRGEFMEEFEVIAFSMNEGEISPVFTTQLGLHICTLIGRRPPQPKPFEEVRDPVRQQIIDAHRDTCFNAFIESLKKTAVIQDSDPVD